MIDIKVFVIKSKDRDIDVGLLNFIEENSLDLTKSPGVFLESGRNLDSIVNFRESYLRIGRGISLSEIGIALAHRHIYEKIIQEDYPWALVMEDDAIVIDSNLLKIQVEKSITFPSDTPNVILLFHHAKELVQSHSKSFFMNSRTVPSYAVAYILNKSAAQALLESQTPISSVADWPLCTHRVDYWLSQSFAIKHGSESQKYSSYLEGITRSPSSFFNKWRWILGIDLIRLNRLSLDALHKHYCFVIRPRISSSRT